MNKYSPLNDYIGFNFESREVDLFVGDTDIKLGAYGDTLFTRLVWDTDEQVMWIVCKPAWDKVDLFGK